MWWWGRGVKCNWLQLQYINQANKENACLDVNQFFLNKCQTISKCIVKIILKKKICIDFVVLGCT